MANVVPIFDESDRFIGLWARNRQLIPSLGSLAELLSLAEPTLQALNNGEMMRSDNYGTVRVGENISFQNGAFLMLDDEEAPPVAFENGQSYIAIAYRNVSIARRSSAPAIQSKHWWQFWKTA